MSRKSHESIIAWESDSDEAVFFTESPTIHRQLVSLGYTADAANEYDGPGARFPIPKKHIRLPSPPVPREQKAAEGGSR